MNDKSPPVGTGGNSGEPPLSPREEMELVALARLLANPSFDFPRHREAALRAEVLEQAEQKQLARAKPGSATGLRWKWWQWVVPTLGAAAALGLTLPFTHLNEPASPAASSKEEAEIGSGATPGGSSRTSREAEALLAAQALVLESRLGTPGPGAGRLQAEEAPARQRPDSSSRRLQAALTDYRRRLLNDWETER